MLFTYPENANDNNWLHEVVYASILSAIDALDAGNDPDLWPAILTAEQRALLSRRKTIKKNYNAFIGELKKLNAPERSSVRCAVITNNNLPGILIAPELCGKISNLSKAFRTATSNLFEAMFDLLNGIGVRGEQYKIIYDDLTVDVCPFCGLEPLPKPGGSQPDWDHYLAKTIYPFAGGNLKNLVPMGSHCNQRVKGAKDIIFDANGGRRRCLDPFGGEVAGVEIVGVQLDDNENIDQATWQVTCVATDASCASTWDQVWQVSNQFSGTIAKRFKNLWLTEFVRISCKGAIPETREELSSALDYMIEYYEALQNSDVAFLKKAVFEWVKAQVEGEPDDGRFTNLLTKACRDHSSQVLA